MYRITEKEKAKELLISAISENFWRNITQVSIYFFNGNVHQSLCAK
jgi:hypothetical protein